MTARPGVAAAAAGVVIAALGAAACRRVPEKTRVLETIVVDVAAPLDLALAGDSEALAAAVDGLARAPSPATLETARASWRRAAVAWRRAFAFREGPVVETNALARAAFWPPNAARLQALLDDSGPVDAGHIEELGADAKGMFVLEVLLFGGAAAPTAAEVSATWGGPAGGRRAALARALAADVVRYARAAGAPLAADKGAALAAAYAARGQASVNRLVNQMVETVEGVYANRLGLVLGLADSRLLRPSEIEGWPSGTSTALALALLTSTQQLYTGVGRGGLGDLVRAASPAQDQRARAAFDAAVGRVQALGAPLEQVVSARRPALETAARATRDLERALKVDVANALGVTLTFTAGDGD